MYDPIPELVALATRHAAPSPRELLPRLTLWSSSAPTAPTPVIYEPMLYFTLQGIKRMSAGDLQLDHQPDAFLLSSIDVPVVCAVRECSPERPYLGLALALDLSVLSKLFVDLPPLAEPVFDDAKEDLCPMAMSSTTKEMSEALLRLVRLADAPAHAPFLRPLIERELLYRVLQSDQGKVLRQLASADSRRSQIYRAVKWILAHVSDPLSVKMLAGVASMSVSSFHRHFRAVTGLSPLAYHKRIRLQEARRLLIAGHEGVAAVAFAVGYESSSQFSREYSRQFGMPPARDAARLRAE